MSDHDEYLSYFWWRDKYRAVESGKDFLSVYIREFGYISNYLFLSDRKFSSRAMCELCRKLNDPQEPEKVIQDLVPYFPYIGKCYPIFNIFEFTS